MPTLSLALLAVLLIAAPSKGPAPTPAKAGQAKQEQTRGAQRQTKADDQSAKKPVSAVQQSSPEITVGYEQRFGDQAKNASPWRDWPAWAVAVFTLGLLIVAVLQWIAMHGQRKLMAGQLDSMKTTGDDTHNLALAAKDAAAAANSSAATAAAMVGVTRQQQRAWMGVIRMDGKPARDSFLSVEIEVSNSGQTPAKRVRTMAVIRLLPEYVGLGDPKNWRKVEGLPRSTTSVAPNNTITFTTQRHENGREPVFTKQEMGDIANRHKRLFVDGRVEYWDVFGDFHWVTFCNELRLFKAPNDWKYVVHETGNDTDEPGTEGTPLL